jgi:hypothetical protein
MDHADQGSAISMMAWICNLFFSLSAEMHTKRQGLIPVALLFPHSTYFSFWRHLTSMLWPWRGPSSMLSPFQTMKRSPEKNSFFDIYFLGRTGLCSIWLCRISSASIFNHAFYSFWEYRSPKNYIRIIKNLRRKSASRLPSHFKLGQQLYVQSGTVPLLQYPYIRRECNARLDCFPRRHFLQSFFIRFGCNFGLKSPRHICLGQWSPILKNIFLLCGIFQNLIGNR